MGKPEGRIESHLDRMAKKNGILCFKFVSPGVNGVPDRILIGNGKTVFVELKAPGEEPRPLQKKIISKMQKSGAIVYVADSKEKADKVIEYMLDGG